MNSSGTDAPAAIEDSIRELIATFAGRSVASTVTPVKGRSPRLLMVSVPVTGLPAVTDTLNAL